MAKEKLVTELVVEDNATTAIKKVTKSIEDLGDTLGGIKKQAEQAEEKIKKVPENLGKETEKAQGKVKGLLGSLNDFSTWAKGFVVFKAVQAIKNFGLAALQASSDVEELRNVTQQVFGNISKDVEEFAKNTAAQIGRSTYSLTKYTSEIGAVITGLGNFDTTQVREMSEQLAVLAVDIASFKNISDDQAFTALVGGITGETESLKRLGIVINDTVLAEYARQKGIKQSWATLDLQTKTELRYQAILEKTKIIQGDAARTIDSYANQLKAAGANINNLLATIGDKLRPTATGILGVFNSLTSSVNEFLTKRSVDDTILDFVKAKNEVKELATEYVNLSKQKLESGLSNEKEQERLNLYNELISKFPELKSVISSEAGEWNKVSSAIGEVIDKIKEKTLAELKSNFTEKLLKEAQKVQAVVDSQIVQATKNINSLEANINNGKFANNLANNKELVNKITTLIAKDRQSGNSVGKDDAYLNAKIDKLLQTVEGYDASVKRNQGTIIDFIIKQGGVNATISNAEKNYQNKVNELKGKFDNDFKTAQNALDRLEKNDGGLFNTVNTVKSDTKELTNLITTANENILDTTGDIRQDVITSKVAILNKLDKISGKLNLSTLKNNISVEKQSDGKVLVIVKDIKSGKLKNNYTFQNVDNAQAFANEILNKEQEEYLRNNPSKKLVAKKIERPKPNRNKISSSPTTESKKKELTELEKILQDLTNQVSNDTLKVTKQELGVYNKIKNTLDVLYKNRLDNVDKLLKDGVLSPLDSLKEQLKLIEDNLSKNKEYYSKTSDKTFLDRYKKLIKDKSEIEKKITSIEFTKKLENEINSLAGNGDKFEDIDKLHEVIQKYQAKQVEKINNDKTLSTSDRARKFEELSQKIKGLYLETGKVVEELSLDIQAQTLKVKDILEKRQKKLEKEGLEKNISQLTQAIDLFRNNNDFVQLKQKSFDTNKKDYLNEIAELSSLGFEDLADNLYKNKVGNHKQVIDNYIKSQNNIDKGVLELLNGLKELNGKLLQDGAILKAEAKKQHVIKLADTVKGVFGDITQNINKITESFGDVEAKEIVSDISKFVGDMVEFGVDLTKAIVTLDPQSIAKAIQSFIDLAVNIIKQFSDPTGQIEYEKARAEYKKEEQGVLLKNTTALESLTESIKTLNESLLKRASENTSNRVIEFNKKLREEYVKSFANNFDSDIKSTSVEKRTLSLSPFVKALLTFFTPGGIGTFIAETAVNKNTAKKGSTRFSELFQSIGNSSQELEAFYNKNLKNFDKNKLISSQEGYDPEKTKEKILGGNGVYKEYDIVSSNIEAIKKDFLKHIDQVKQLEQQQKQFTKDVVLNSFEGINILDPEEQKRQILEDFKKIYANTDNFDKRYKELQAKVNELVKGNENVVTAFNDVRQSTIQSLANGNSAIESLANGLQGYFNKLRTNIAKVKYDGVFRELETEFNQAFSQISDKLADLRVNGSKDLKSLGKDINFNSLFSKLKATESINNDIKDVVTVLRQQAKSQGLSEEYINLLFPTEDVKDKILDVRSTLAQAMQSALNTNSFDQFSFSLGDSLYNSVKNNLIRAFSETDSYKALIKKITEDNDYEARIRKTKDVGQAFELIKEQLSKTDEILKAHGLGFRETNGITGEYFGGLTNRANQVISPTSTIQGISQGINIELYITNNGYLSTENIADDMVKKVLEKLKEKQEREV